MAEIQVFLPGRSEPVSLHSYALSYGGRELQSPDYIQFDDPELSCEGDQTSYRLKFLSIKVPLA